MNTVIPAKAGIQRLSSERHWVHAFAVTTQFIAKAVTHFASAQQKPRTEGIA
jgi:hypothetical protein